MSSSSSNTSSPLTTRKIAEGTSGTEGRSSGEDEEITDITTTVSERSPTTAVEAGNRDATTISTDSAEFPVDDPNSGSTESGPDPLDPHDFMTSSYSEISFGTENEASDNALTETGVVDEAAQVEVKQLASNIANWTEQKLVSYVAEDLEERLKMASSISQASESHDETHTLSQQQQSSIGPDIQTLQYLETTVSKLSENINQVLISINQSTHSLSGLTVECMKSYERCLTETADVVDQNIKSMYQLMAQVEEVNRSMKSIEPLKKELIQVKHLLDVFERSVP